MKKQIIIAIVAIAILGGAYYYFTSKDSAPSNTGGTLSGNKGTALLGTTGSVAQSQQPIGADILSLLNRINSLKIDTTIFNSLVYQSLVDFSVPIPPQHVGRPNPFAPISGGGAPAGPSAPSGLPHN